MSKSYADEYRQDSPGTGRFMPPEEITKRFDVLERLAENDSGETFLLTDKADSRRYVLKCYKKSEATGETRESEILRELSHKGLPKFEAEIEDGDMLYVLREYAQGVPLGQYMEDAGGRLGAARALSIAAELCDILTYLHSQPAPVIHRDLKPSNIIVDPEAADGAGVKLIDFGISRRFSSDSDSDTTYYGTKKFSPPEQYGFTQTDCRADIYALGIVLRYMLTGELDGEVADKGLQRIIDKCTAFSPNDRYKSAAVLKKEIARYRSNTRRNAARVVAASLALCAALAVGFSVGRYTDFLALPSAGADTLGVAPADEPVTFAEPLVEATVRLMLDRTNDEPITHSDLSEITHLYIYGKTPLRSLDELNMMWGSSESRFGTMTSLDDLPLLINLRGITLLGQPIYDLTPLVDCFLLEEVNIYGSPITDISPLSSMPRLKSLFFSECEVRDFSCLAGIETLQGLGIDTMPLASFSAIAAYQITGLSVKGTDITSLDGLEHFTRLTSIDIHSTSVSDFSPLDAMPNITQLYISADMERYLDTMTRDDIDVIIW